ncbi:MAG: hypothetical protein KKB89_00005, partial [Candidatus Omnitrophica bacterium]|nr:hypothetical protein [Candidatus Omnitrophota bacterium]
MVDRLKKLPSELKKILTIASRQATSSGVKIYLVGGVVRDLIKGKINFDLDIVVESDAIIFAREYANYLGGEFKKHHAFGTATVYLGEHKVDFATARRETYPRWGALPVVVPAALEDDLARRDFTINAMAVSLNKGDYGRCLDLYNGLSDLSKGLIRVLHKDSFLEDPTRILRAIRFEQRFSFKIEKNTFKLMREALGREALKFIHPHRLRNELVLILKEPKPRIYIGRIEKLINFSILDKTPPSKVLGGSIPVDKSIKLDREDFKLFLRIEKTVSFYQEKFKKLKEIEEWFVYLAAILVKLSEPEILQFVESFGLRKEHRVKMLSIKKNLSKIKRLNRELRPHAIYHFFQLLSFEAIVFFYAYYPEKKIRENIEYFLDKLVNVTLFVKGEDLKKLGMKPVNLYSKLLRRLLYVKLDDKLKTKQEEIRQAKVIFRKLKSREDR